MNKNKEDTILKNLSGLNRKELKIVMEDMEVPEKQINMRVNQVWNWLYVKGAKTIEDMTDLSKDFRSKFKNKYNLVRPEISKHEVSSDGTQKWLIQFPDESEIETVFIPDDSRGTLCVSSQVGCTLNCTFCYTGTQRLVRNLTSQEIVNQLLIAKDSLKEWNKSQRDITNIVMMGMGEPLYNFENVRDGINVFSDAVSYTHLTLPTILLV